MNISDLGLRVNSNEDLYPINSNNQNASQCILCE